MKNILLLGASGKTGTEVLKYALARGYHVMALVRDKGKINVRSGQLTLITGTPVNIHDVRVIGDFEAVISTLGHPFFSDNDRSVKMVSHTLMADSINNIIILMKEKGIRRIIVQTGAGAGDSFTIMPAPLKKVIRNTGLKLSYADHDAQENLVMNSGLDWTIVRPVSLTDGAEGKINVLKGRVRQLYSISRKTVAKFLVSCLETDEFTGKAVVIYEKK